MARASGARARMRVKFETTPGTIPTGNWTDMPFVSSDLGEEQGLIESDLLGQDRESYDPTPDVSNDAGDLVVPVDARAFGIHLKHQFGDPVTTPGDAATGSIAFSAQPAAASTVTINGTAFTFVASGATGNQVNLGANLAATMTALVTVLNASVVTGVAAATYTGTATALTIVHDTLGVAGNTFTLAASAPSNGTPSGATLSGGTYAHAFTTGAAVLPALSIEIGHPEIPSFTVHYKTRAGTMRIAMSRRGLLNATIGEVAQGETAAAVASVGGTPTGFLPNEIIRFAQATGKITLDGVQLADVVSADWSHSNNLDLVETIRPDGEIEDADPQNAMVSGNVTIRYGSNAVKAKAESGTPVALTFGWINKVGSLTITVPRVFLPKAKNPIAGPRGIQASYPWQASAGVGGHACTITLKTDVASF